MVSNKDVRYLCYSMYYKVNGFIQTSIKITTYADDATYIVIDELSITEIINEFDIWCSYSGAKLNITKTTVMTNDLLFYNQLSIQVENDTKILGVYFDHNGISTSNFNNINKQ